MSERTGQEVSNITAFIWKETEKEKCDYTTSKEQQKRRRECADELIDKEGRRKAATDNLQPRTKDMGRVNNAQ